PKPELVQPATAAIDTHAAVRRFGCRPIYRRLGVAIGVTIPCPLPDVADHVVKSERIRRLQSDCLSFPIGIIFVPRMRSCAVVVVAPPKSCGSSGAGSILPFRFAGQPIRAGLRFGA